LKKFILKELLKPTLRRLGSMIAGGLITLGVAEQSALAIETGVIAAVAVACDLLLSFLDRKSNEGTD
jgi:predicted membrane-bound dolichyl-phosphate-mannose-protein mannosyltransferase